MSKAERRLNLTDFVIARLEPRARKYLVYDVDVRWLAVETQPTGHKFLKYIRCNKWRTIGPAEIGVGEGRKRALRWLLDDLNGVPAEAKPSRTQQEVIR